jgi:hypothetical protein
VKSINKKVGTFVNNKSTKIKESKSKAESYGLLPQYFKLESTDGQIVKFDFNPSSSKICILRFA